MMMARVGSRRVRESVPRSENAKDRLVDLGAQALANAELLAIVADISRERADGILKGAEQSLRRIAMQVPAALTMAPGMGVGAGSQGVRGARAWPQDGRRGTRRWLARTFAA